MVYDPALDDLYGGNRPTAGERRAVSDFMDTMDGIQSVSLSQLQAADEAARRRQIAEPVSDHDAFSTPGFLTPSSATRSGLLRMLDEDINIRTGQTIRYTSPTAAQIARDAYEYDNEGQVTKTEWNPEMQTAGLFGVGDDALSQLLVEGFNWLGKTFIDGFEALPDIINQRNAGTGPVYGMHALGVTGSGQTVTVSGESVTGSGVGSLEMLRKLWQLFAQFFGFLPSGVSI